MAVIIADHKLTKNDIKKALEDIEDFIKITIDIKQNIAAIGGEYHSDAERVLYEQFESNFSEIWGGGYDIREKKFRVDAMINRKPNTGNDSAEILDPITRQNFIKLANKIINQIESLI